MTWGEMLPWLVILTWGAVLLRFLLGSAVSSWVMVKRVSEAGHPLMSLLKSLQVREDEEPEDDKAAKPRKDGEA